jgi:hypothetical protein
MSVDATQTFRSLGKKPAFDWRLLSFACAGITTIALLVFFAFNILRLVVGS